jgi:hypothetical protein
MPPDWPHRPTMRERLLNAGIVLLLVYFTIFVVVSLGIWIALSNR